MRMALNLLVNLVVLLLVTPTVDSEESRDRAGKPLLRMNEQIDSLNATIATLQDELSALDNANGDLQTQLDVISKCLDPPFVKFTQTSMSYSSGRLYATYSCLSSTYQVAGSQTSISCQDGTWPSVNLKCSDLSDCYVYISGKARYSGQTAITRWGSTCQEWNDDWNHGHGFSDSSMAWTNGIGTETLDSAYNFCRDPDGEGKPWCYTVTSTRWDYCHVPRC